MSAVVVPAPDLPLPLGLPLVDAAPGVDEGPDVLLPALGVVILVGEDLEHLDVLDGRIVVVDDLLADHDPVRQGEHGHGTVGFTCLLPPKKEK